jgi:hypothetical protein
VGAGLDHFPMENAPDPEIPLHPAARKTRSAFRGGIVDSKYGVLRPKPDQPCLTVSATRGSFDRAIVLLDQLLRLLEAEGFSVAMPESGKTQMRVVHGPTQTDVEFCLKEEIERYERELTEKDKGRSYIWDRWRYRPTGRFKLLIQEFFPEGVQKSWGEGKNTRLERKLADAAAGFAVCARGKHAGELERREREIRWKEEQRLREEAEARLREETERRKTLQTAAKNWSEAELLRSFRTACVTRLRSVMPGGVLNKAQEGWLQWVDRAITEGDPLTAGFLRRIEALVDPDPPPKS